MTTIITEPVMTVLAETATVTVEEAGIMMMMTAAAVIPEIMISDTMITNQDLIHRGLEAEKPAVVKKPMIKRNNDNCTINR